MDSLRDAFGEKYTPRIDSGIIAARKQGKTFIYSLKDVYTYLHTHNRHNSLREADHAGHVELAKGHVSLPKEGNILRRIGLDDWKLGEFLICVLLSSVTGLSCE